MGQGKKKNQNNKSNTNKLPGNSAAARQNYLLPLFIILLATIISYLPVFHNGFINLDDDKYIQNNLLIRSINIKEIFSHFFEGNYHPLTLFVYSIEFQFWGLNANGYHAINLLLHLFNAVLVFYIILLLTDKKEIAFVASLLFGIHPLHVETVAWASELKDLLYTFFFLSSYLNYLRFRKEKKSKYYSYSILLFIFSLLSKAMAVPLPLVLLLTDYFQGRKLDAKAWIEKLPYFILAIITGALAIVAQKSSGAIQHLDYYSLPQRMLFACYGFITYLVKLIIPYSLCAYYPYPVKSGAGIPAIYYLYPFIVLALISFVIYSLRRSKKIFFATGFFSITVFIVLQLLPVGNTIMADRYSYIPSIGIFYLAGELFYSIWSKKKSAGSLKIAAPIVLSVIGLFYMIAANNRCHVWENSLVFWNDVIEKYKTVPVAYNNRGMALEAVNKTEEALPDYSSAIELQPDFAMPYNNRGNLLMNRQQNDLALIDYTKAIELDPHLAEPRNGKGVLLLREKKFEEAIELFRKAIELRPNYPEVYYNLAICEFNVQKKDDACRDLQKAINLGVKQGTDLFNQLCR
jgi:tetratricopeptide (TPR) repeat protein